MWFEFLTQRKKFKFVHKATIENKLNNNFSLNKVVLLREFLLFEVEVKRKWIRVP